jgi:transposase
MSNPHNVGIDVSMKRLDVAILPAGARFSVANDDAGWAELVDRLRQFAIAAVGLEPTGGYERGIDARMIAAYVALLPTRPVQARRSFLTRTPCARANWRSLAGF